MLLNNVIWTIEMLVVQVKLELALWVWALKMLWHMRDVIDISKLQKYLSLFSASVADSVNYHHRIEL